LAGSDWLKLLTIAAIGAIPHLLPWIIASAVLSGECAENPIPQLKAERLAAQETRIIDLMDI